MLHGSLLESCDSILFIWSSCVVR